MYGNYIITINTYTIYCNTRDDFNERILSDDNVGQDKLCAIGTQQLQHSRVRDHSCSTETTLGNLLMNNFSSSKSKIRSTDLPYTQNEYSEVCMSGNFHFLEYYNNYGVCLQFREAA